jgi:hypothetical protein
LNSEDQRQGRACELTRFDETVAAQLMKEKNLRLFVAIKNHSLAINKLPPSTIFNFELNRVRGMKDVIIAWNKIKPANPNVQKIHEKITDPGTGR